LIPLRSPALADAPEEAQVGRRMGGWEKTSQHTPTWTRLAARQPLKTRSRSSRRNEDDE